MAGPNKNKKKQHSSAFKTEGAMLQKKKAIGWLYTATDKYYITGPSSKITKSKIHIQYCLEKIMTSSPHVSNWETIVTYPFQKCSSRKQSPFMHACALGNVDLMEYYLSLFIMVRLTKRQINNPWYGATFRTWMLTVKHGSSIVKDFDLYLDQEYNEDDVSKVMDGRKLSTENIFDIVLSFLVDHPKRESKINLIIKSFIQGPHMTRSKNGRGSAARGKSKKRLPKINCQDNLDLNLDDVYDEDEYSYDADYNYYDQPEMYENTEANEDHKVSDDAVTTASCYTSKNERNEEEEHVPEFLEEEAKMEDELSSGWEDMFELDSLSDGEISEGIISFNASFGNDIDSSIENPNEIIHNVGDDWDAIPEVQSVISVDTFSGEKLLFSYKDALFVNKEEQETSTFGKVTMQLETHDGMASTNRAKNDVEVEMRDESDLRHLSFDHNSAKLKGGQRRTLRKLKGN